MTAYLELPHGPEARESDALPERVPADPAAGLPRRLRRVLERELCPGERVEWIGQPGMARLALLGRDLAWWTAGITTMWLLAPTQGGAGIFAAWCVAAFVGLLQLAARARGCRNIAYVATDQRCFRLAAAGFGVQVREVTALPKGSDLDLTDLVELRDRLTALQRNTAGPAGAPRRAPARNSVDSLPCALRSRLEQELLPGEELRWVYRPTAGDYLLHAPVSASVALSGSLAGLASLSAFIAFLVAGSLFTTPAAVALMFWALTGWLIRRQVRDRVYAVTGLRGLVLAGRGPAAAFTPAELRRFQRTEDASGRGNLAPAGAAGAAFYGVRDVKALDDLVRGRAMRDRSTELVPIATPDGRGDEPSPPG